MTGRELIMYILENHLEDEPVFQNGTFVGYVSDVKFAEILGVGVGSRMDHDGSYKGRDYDW